MNTAVVVAVFEYLRLLMQNDKCILAVSANGRLRSLVTHHLHLGRSCTVKPEFISRVTSTIAW
jgi:hypothetical protein